MNTALVNRRRALLPTFNLLLAVGACVLAVVAIEADDVGSIAPSPQPPPPIVTVVGPAHPLGAVMVAIPCDELVYTRC